MRNLPIKKTIIGIELLFSVVCGFVGAVLLFAILPIPGNYKLLVVQSGSMEPTVPVGSIVLVQPQSEYTIGDVITFAPSQKEPNKYVTHRINGYAPDTVGLIYQTKGDANKTADPTSLPKESIFGKVHFIIPSVGILFHHLKTPLGFILVVIVPATIIIYEELRKVYLSVAAYVRNFFIQKKRNKMITANDDQFLQSIEKLRMKERGEMGTKFLMVFLMFGISFAFVGFTHSFFSDIEIGSASIAAAAFGSPTPSVSPSPLPAHIVINEVFADVDDAHGFDSPGDRGVMVGGHTTQVRIENNGSGSSNEAFVDIESLCSVVQNNHTNVTINLDVSGNTGNNSASGNTGGSTNTESGDVSNTIVVDAHGGTNTLGDFCGNGRQKNHEWIELFNPTDEIVNLKNWTITDNSGIAVTIHGNKYIGPHEFALITRASSTWSFWDEPSGVLKIALGRQIGDGLDDLGDHLILKNPEGVTIDGMSYGDDISEFVLNAAGIGDTVGREIAGFDTDASNDWIEQFLPSPGT